MLKKLADCIDSYLEGKISREDLTKFTLEIIADDNTIDKLPDEIQKNIYALDMEDVNELSDRDIAEIGKHIRKYADTKN